MGSETRLSIDSLQPCQLEFHSVPKLEIVAHPSPRIIFIIDSNFILGAPAKRWWRRPTSC
jgi:hypothetical protein